MAILVFLTVDDAIKSSTYLKRKLADLPQTVESLTVAEETRCRSWPVQPRPEAGVEPSLRPRDQRGDLRHLFKCYRLLKGRTGAANNNVGGPEHSTRAIEGNPCRFDFMLRNPPYGKSWKSDLAAHGWDDVHRGLPLGNQFSMRSTPEYSLISRSSDEADAQYHWSTSLTTELKEDTQLGSLVIAKVPQRQVTVQRRRRATWREQYPDHWIIENDWLDPQTCPS